MDANVPVLVLREHPFGKNVAVRVALDAENNVATLEWWVVKPQEEDSTGWHATQYIYSWMATFEGGERTGNLPEGVFGGSSVVGD